MLPQEEGFRVRKKGSDYSEYVLIGVESFVLIFSAN
jgi:hypothetical protein